MNQMLINLHEEFWTGCLEGMGMGNVSSGGAGGGGGHGGKGGSGVYGTIISNGGDSYGKSELPCELGSGGGNPGSGNATAGGGLIGDLSTHIILTF